MVIIGLVGRICSGKSTIMQEYGNKYKIEMNTLLGWDLQEVFELDYLKNFDSVKIWIEEQRSLYSVNKEICQKVLFAWEGNHMIEHIFMDELVEFMFKRNYFHLVWVECPSLQRYKNFQEQYKNLALKVSLEDFLMIDDYIYYNTLINLHRLSKIQFLNLNNLEKMQSQIQKVNYFSPQVIPFRPTYDEYFMKVAFELKNRSNCMKRSVGALLTKNNRIIATGYNGTPRGLKNCHEGGCLRCNTNTSQGVDLDKCYCIHAEENCFLEAGVHAAKGCTLYTTLFPCTWCAKIIVHAGVESLFYCIDFNQNESKQLLQQTVKSITQLKMDNYMF